MIYTVTASTLQRGLRELPIGRPLYLGGVYEQIKHKLVCGYQSLGDRQVKNITDPSESTGCCPTPPPSIKARPMPGLAQAIILSVSLIAGAAAATATWYFFVWQPKHLASNVPQASARHHHKPCYRRGPADGTGEQARDAAVACASSAAIRRDSAGATAQAPVISEPEMVTLPAGTFAMGSNEDPSEKPIHQVKIKSFAIGKFPVTVREWNQCVAAKKCTNKVTGNDDAPVTNVSWNDAQQFTEWLSGVNSKAITAFRQKRVGVRRARRYADQILWGDQPSPGMANCKGCSEPYDATQPMKVGSYKPNLLVSTIWAAAFLNG